VWNDVIQKGERNAAHSKPKNSQWKGSSYTIYRLLDWTARWDLSAFYCPDDQFGESILDKINKKVEEKYIDTMAEKLVKPSFNQLEPSHSPAFAKSAYRIPQPVSLSLPPESIFGITYVSM